MKKEINCRIKLEIKGAEANPGLKQIGPALGGKIGNIMEFCKQFNAQTQDKKGVKVRVLVTAYKDKEKSFSFILRGSPTAELLKGAAKIQVGSAEPNKKKVGSISMSAVEEVAKQQMSYLNSFGLDAAVKVVLGTAKRIGLEIIN